VTPRPLPAPPFLLLGALSLLAGLWAGLLRLPTPLPALHGLLAALHGPLMAGAFLGTVICAERAAALGGRPLLWLPALLHGMGGLAMIAGPALPGPMTAVRTAALLMTAGAAGLVLLFVPILRRQRTFFNTVMALGALALLAAHMQLWLRGSAVAATPWWAAFLVLTIAGERLELNRLMKPSPRAETAFKAILLLQLAALAATGWSLELGLRLQGAGHLLLAIWLGVNDIARRTIRLPGPPRYAAFCLLSGYCWLAAAGLLALVGPCQVAGPWRDASLHALFLGFVFAMIFGHAPIIVPALTGLAVKLNRGFHVALLLLHAGLTARIVGDLGGWSGLRVHGGETGVAAILLFLVVLFASLRRSGTSAA
jgi:hypothetical protein